MKIISFNVRQPSADLTLGTKAKHLFALGHFFPQARASFFGTTSCLEKSFRSCPAFAH
jgi:hypothetical protein